MTLGYHFLLLDNPPKSKIAPVCLKDFLRDQQKSNREERSMCKRSGLPQADSHNYRRVKVPKFKLPVIDHDNPIYLPEDSSSYRTFGSLSMRTARRNYLKEAQSFNQTSRSSANYRSKLNRFEGEGKNRMSRSLVDSKKDIQNEISHEDTFKYSSSNFSKMKPKFNLTGSRISGISGKDFPWVTVGRKNFVESGKDSLGFENSSRDRKFVSHTRNSVIGESENEQSLEAMDGLSSSNSKGIRIRETQIELLGKAEASPTYSKSGDSKHSTHRTRQARAIRKNDRTFRNKEVGIEKAFNIVLGTLN